MVRQRTNLNEIKTKLETHQRYLREVFHVKEVGIFGSYVTGRQTLRSDIDILVTFEKGYKDFFNYMRLKRYLEEFLGNRVDLVIKEAVKERLRKKILDEVVYVR
jgi:predicted nucleotidyltransferase